MSVRVRLQLEPTPTLPVDLNETLPWYPLRRVQPEPRPEPQVRCIRCEGRMERGTVPVQIERNGFRASWDSLPAWVCSRCESPYFEENEVRLVRSVLEAMKLLSAQSTPRMIL
jgi:uncharacterized protein with PIN domain